MKEADKIPVFNTIQDMYQHLGLPVDKIEINSEFAIHNLGDIHTILP